MIHSMSQLNMVFKSHITLFFFLCILLTLGGCAEEKSVPGEDDRVVLQPGIAAATARPADSRSIVNGIGTDVDRIQAVGIYLERASDHATYPGTPDAGTVFNAPTVEGQPWTPPVSGTVYVNANAGRLFAWSPSTSVLTRDAAAGKHSIPVNVPAAQTFNGANTYACSVTDYLYGSGSAAVGSSDAIAVSSTSASPAVYMQHALAQIVFLMVNDAGRPADAAYDYVKKITLTANGGSTPFKAAASGNMLLSDGTLTGQTACGELTFTPTENPRQVGATGSPAIVAYGLVAPKAAASSGTVKLSLVLGEANLSKTDTERDLFIESAGEFNIEWKKGERYLYTLTLGKRGITISGADIKGWETASSTETMPPIMD